MQEAEVTNAGFGSNLTLEGSVEADASIMLGDRSFGAVGAAPGLNKNCALCALPVEQEVQCLALDMSSKLICNDEAYLARVRTHLQSCNLIWQGLGTPLQ